MRKFGLIGFPLGHSFSKKYFTGKFESGKINDCNYENYPLDSIEKLPGLVMSEKVEGLNVTIPYKSSVFKFLDKIDTEASEIGAVNVIKVTYRAGKPFLHGFNSDITGIRDTLFPYADIYQKNAVVLGSGGSSRAVCYVLRKLGFNYSIVSRSPKTGFLTYENLTGEILRETRLIINTTPLGMYPDTLSKPDLNYDQLTSDHILFDLVYNPEITSFLKEGKERGCTVLTGLTMLYSQAERSWEIWNDKDL